MNLLATADASTRVPASKHRLALERCTTWGETKDLTNEIAAKGVPLRGESSPRAALHFFAPCRQLCLRLALPAARASWPRQRLYSAGAKHDTRRNNPGTPTYLLGLGHSDAALAVAAIAQRFSCTTLHAPLNITYYIYQPTNLPTERASYLQPLPRRTAVLPWWT